MMMTYDGCRGFNSGGKMSTGAPLIRNQPHMLQYHAVMQQGAVGCYFSLYHAGVMQQGTAQESWFSFAYSPLKTPGTG